MALTRNRGDGFNTSDGLYHGHGVVVLDTDGQPLTPAGGAVSSATVTAVASSATSVEILAANAARRGVFLTNTDANVVRVKYGTTASATSFTVALAQNGYWEMPLPVYNGVMHAIWDVDGAGSLIITEI